jgi:hypothetical protein
MSEDETMEPRTDGARSAGRTHRRKVAADGGRLEHVALLHEVPAGEAVLVLGRRNLRARSTEAGRVFEATLRFPGRLGPRQRVELEVQDQAGGQGVLVVRRVGPLSRRLSEERYDRAVLGALGAIEHLLPWQEVSPTSLPLEVARELLEQSGALAPGAPARLDTQLEQALTAIPGTQDRTGEAERVA